GADDVGIRHIPLWVVILINCENSRVTRIQSMKHLEVVGVVRQQHKAHGRRIMKVIRVLASGKTDIRWNHYLMPRSAKDSNQCAGIEAIIEIDPLAQADIPFQLSDVVLRPPLPGSKPCVGRSTEVLPELRRSASRSL